MIKRFFDKICCLMLVVLSLVTALTACAKIEFKIDFIVDNAIYATINTSGEEMIKMPEDPKKEGYVFDGWYWDKDSWKKPFTANSLLDAPLSDNMSVYAKWNEEQPVKPSEPSEPSNDTQAEFERFEKTGEYEYSLKVPNSTKKLVLKTLITINALSSWTLSTDVEGIQTVENKVAALNVGDNTFYVLVTAEDGSTQLYTLKIRRKAMYNVIFDTAGGTSVENQQVEEGGIAQAPETTKVGYDFSAWDYDFTTPITENKTIIASWTVKEYTITYHLDGGRNDADNPTSYTIESDQITLKVPTRENYTFEGWYTSNDFASNFKVTGISKGSVGNLDLYAKWTAITSDEEDEEDEEEVDNLPNVTITQTQSQYVTNRNYATMENGAYAKFVEAATPEYLVPGLVEGLIPQSMDVWEEKDLLLISGYFVNGKNKSGSPSSMIVTVDLKTGKLVGKYCLKNVNDEYLTIHAGGLAVTEKNIFISNNKKLFRIPLSQLEELGNSGTLKVSERIFVAALGSFCNYSDGVIWVGDFVNNGTETPSWRHGLAGGSYKAWVVGYKVKDTESEFSSENWNAATMEYATPDYAFTITNKVQGFAIVNGKVVLSASYGRNNNATTYVYNNPLQSTQDGSITLNGKDVPIWVLDDTFFNVKYTTMPMSEGCTSYNGKLLLLFESGTLEYYNGKNPTDHIWSVTLPE